VRFWSLDHHRREVASGPPSAWPLLVFARSGCLIAESERHRWYLPPSRALWVPSGLPCTIRTVQAASVRSLYFCPELCLGREPGPLSVSPLLHELIVAVCARGPLLDDRPYDRALAAVVAAEVQTAPTVPTGLPWPDSPWLRSLAEDAFATTRPLAALVAATGYSRRTIERAMVSETGLSLGRWFRQARLLRSLVQISQGATVADASFAAGYSEPSAFSHAFRRAFGFSPGRTESESVKRRGSGPVGPHRYPAGLA
jgi:AraC-like DNA-binding protein